MLVLGIHYGPCGVEDYQSVSQIGQRYSPVDEPVAVEGVVHPWGQEGWAHHCPRGPVNSDEYPRYDGEGAGDDETLPKAKRLMTDSRSTADSVSVMVPRALRVAIAGKVKAGKSTLLNALVGDELAPTDAGECTQVPWWFHDGLTYRVTLHPKHGPSRPARFVEYSTSVEQSFPAKRKRTYCASEEGQNPLVPDEVVKLEEPAYLEFTALSDDPRLYDVVSFLFHQVDSFDYLVGVYLVVSIINHHDLASRNL